MKIAIITSNYSDYLNKLYSGECFWKKKSYMELQSMLNHDAFGWTDFFKNALEAVGYDVLNIVWNAELLQWAWARENMLYVGRNSGLKLISLTRLKEFKPEILWFVDNDGEFLQQIIQEINSIRIVVGWVGSAISPMGRLKRVFDQCDLVLSCAPESVARLNTLGYKSMHLNHAFDPRVLSRLKPAKKELNLTFIGQLILKNEFHLKREIILNKFVENTDIIIFAKLYPKSLLKKCITAYKEKSLFKALLNKMVSVILKTVKKLKLILGSTNSKVVTLDKIDHHTQTNNGRKINPRLEKVLRHRVYGLEMYQTVTNSKIALNIHADSSSDFASNMRLFEITGVGTCMVTEWKKNINQLFEPGVEIVTFKSIDECIEKVMWLLDNPETLNCIAIAGQKRTLKEHTFSQRAIQLDGIFKELLAVNLQNNKYYRLTNK